VPKDVCVDVKGHNCLYSRFCLLYYSNLRSGGDYAAISHLLTVYEFWIPLKLEYLIKNLKPREKRSLTACVFKT
jgi:hypothetical protein